MERVWKLLDKWGWGLEDGLVGDGNLGGIGVEVVIEVMSVDDVVLERECEE